MKMTLSFPQFYYDKVLAKKLRKNKYVFVKFEFPRATWAGNPFIETVEKSHKRLNFQQGKFLTKQLPERAIA